MAPIDYRTREHTESTMEQMSEGAREAGRRAVSLTDDIADAIRERPYTAMAVAAGLAFAVGALWKLSHSRQPSTLEAWTARMPELPSRDAIIPRRWR